MLGFIDSGRQFEERQLTTKKHAMPFIVKRYNPSTEFYTVHSL